jgi:hypothetical protein
VSQSVSYTQIVIVTIHPELKNIEASNTNATQCQQMAPDTHIKLKLGLLYINTIDSAALVGP